MPFLTFEGIDGSGKSSLLKSLVQYLKGTGLPIEITREPGGTPLGSELREILLRTTGVAPCPQAELLIYEADRAQHVETFIKPLLKKGHWVLSDRYSDSSLAFQGAGRKIKRESVVWLNDFATQGLVPDITILVDCPVEVSFARRAKRESSENSKADRFENENTVFHQAVRDEFLAIAKSSPKRFLVLDAQKSPQELLDQLLKELRARKIL